MTGVIFYANIVTASLVVHRDASALLNPAFRKKTSHCNPGVLIRILPPLTLKLVIANYGMSSDKAYGAPRNRVVETNA